MKKFVVIGVVALVFSLLIACSGAPTTTNKNPYTVKMGAADFATTSISIPKGSALTFVNDTDTGSLHILVVGRNGQNETENGSSDFGGPAGHRAEVGDTWTTPPWNMAGTYDVTCTVHPFMNLKVVVAG